MPDPQNKDNEFRLSYGEVAVYTLAVVVFIGLLCLNIYSSFKGEMQAEEYKHRLHMLQLECEPIDDPIPEDVLFKLDYNLPNKKVM